MSDLKDRIVEKVEELETEDFVGTKLGGFDKALLIIGDTDINDHLRMQPSAVCYYGMLLRRADAALRRREAAYDEWFHRMYAKANNVLSEERTTKPTQADIKARVIGDNKEKYKKLQKKIVDARDTRDMLDVWYEAIRQKGFSMDKMVDISKEELLTKDHAKKKVDRILKKKGKK